MLEAERRQPGNIVGQYLVPLGPELIERHIHVNGVPEHDEVDDESERTKLVLLSLAIALAQFSTLAMKEDAGELMASFAPIELDEDASSIAVVVDKPQQVKYTHSNPRIDPKSPDTGRPVSQAYRQESLGLEETPDRRYCFRL